VKGCSSTGFLEGPSIATSSFKCSRKTAFRTTSAGAWLGPSATPGEASLSQSLEVLSRNV